MLCLMRQLTHLILYFQFQIFDYGRKVFLVVCITMNYFSVKIEKALNVTAVRFQKYFDNFKIS